MLDFEQDLRPLESQLEAVRRQSNGSGGGAEEQRLRAAIAERLTAIYRDLTPWQKVQVARHRERPYTLDYLRWAFSDFVELHGDRSFGDDRAIVGGPALLDGRSVMVVGQQKGRDTRESVDRSFGMPHPEGYRKAERLMRMAERLGMPVVTLVDTPGAHAGLDSEERGQAEAIASSISTLLTLGVPSICVVIGEGGSGGALALAATDRLLMLEHATFTVASPEAAAAILWRDAGRAPAAAEHMKITAQELKRLGLIDGIIPEPVGGAHRDHAGAAAALSAAVRTCLGEFDGVPADQLRERRYQRYRSLRFHQG
jgi:acetyl-CoA carboxylase carboxyl transferase subunit alpha